MRKLVLLLVTIALAGCTSDPPPPAAADASVSLPPSAVPPEAVLGGEHAHDLWADAFELVLLDAQAATETTCAGHLKGFASLSAEGFAVGCARFAPEPGAVVPQGTKSVRIEVDASAALKAGSYTVEARTHARTTLSSEPTEEPETVVRFALDANDWDLPHEGHSSFGLVLRASAPHGVLDGEIRVRAVVERDPAWVPIVDPAHLDHWILGDRHAFVREGVAVSLDTETTVHEDAVTDSAAGPLAGPNPQVIPLEDIILPGSKFAVLVVHAKEWSGCPPAAACGLTAALQTGSGFGRPPADQPVQTRSGPGWKITAYPVPAWVGEDSTYATESASQVSAFIRVNHDLPMASTSVPASPTDVDVKTRFAVESWRGDVDLADVQARYGLAGA